MASHSTALFLCTPCHRYIGFACIVAGMVVIWCFDSAQLHPSMLILLLSSIQWQHIYHGNPMFDPAKHRDIASVLRCTVSIMALYVMIMSLRGMLQPIPLCLVNATSVARCYLSIGTHFQIGSLVLLCLASSK